MKNENEYQNEIWYDFCGGDGFTYKILTNR